MSAEDYMFESGDWADWSYTYNGYHKRSRHYKQCNDFDYIYRPYTASERKAYGYRSICAFYTRLLDALPVSLKKKAFHLLFKHNLQYKMHSYTRNIPKQYNDAFRRIVFNLAETDDLTNAWLNTIVYSYFKSLPKDLQKSLLKGFVDNYNLDLNALNHIREYNIDA